MIFSVTALASLSSGKLLAGFGWTSLNIALFPFVIAALVMVGLLLRDARKPAAA